MKEFMSIVTCKSLKQHSSFKDLLFFYNIKSTKKSSNKLKNI